MTLWAITSSPYPADSFGAIYPPEEVLFDVDGPSIFTFRDQYGTLILAYACDDDETTNRYIATPTSQQIIESLQNGVISIRASLEQPLMWVLDTSFDGKVENAWVTTPPELPRDALPEPHVLLYPALQPLLRLHVEGQEIREGNVPSAVIKQTVTGVEKALKKLVDYVLERAPTGRPPEELRKLYALNAQQLAFGSFEIAFREPAHLQGDLFRDEEQRQGFERVKHLFNRGVQWAASESMELTELGETEEEQSTVLQAIQELTPPTRGAITHIAVSGRMVDRPPTSAFRLTRESRHRVRSHLRQILHPEKVALDIEGVIGELDRDNLSLKLRDESNEWSLRFEPEFFEEVLDAFTGERRVRIISVRMPPSSPAFVVAIFPVESTPG